MRYFVLVSDADIGTAGAELHDVVLSHATAAGLAVYLHGEGLAERFHLLGERA